MNLDQRSRDAVDAMRHAIEGEAIPALDPVGSERRRRRVRVLLATAAAIVVILGGAGLLAMSGRRAAPPAGQTTTTVASTQTPTSLVPDLERLVERVGSRIPLLDEIGPVPDSFPAREAFHVSQGFGAEGASDSSVSAIPDYGFSLFVDGDEVVGERELIVEEGEWQRISWVFNFPDGLPAGSHTFRAVWRDPDRPTGDDAEATIQFR